MQSQLELLREISQGKKPANIETIGKAFNREILVSEAANEQSRSVQSISDLLAVEQSQLERAIFKGKKQLERIKSVSLETDEKAGLKRLDLDKVRGIVKQSSETHSHRVTGSDPDEVYRILWGLVEVTARNEQSIVPANAEIVHFSMREGLIKSESVGSGKLRIRIV